LSSTIGPSDCVVIFMLCSGAPPPLYFVGLPKTYVRFVHIPNPIPFSIWIRPPYAPYWICLSTSPSGSPSPFQTKDNSRPDCFRLQAESIFPSAVALMYGKIVQVGYDRYNIGSAGSWELTKGSYN